MDLAFALFLGYFALPWYFMGGLVLLFLVDIALCEADEFGWATTALVVGVGIAAWLGAGINPFAYVWNNFAEVFTFFVLYFAVGAVWSIAKWYFFLLKRREQHIELLEAWERNYSDASEHDSSKRRGKPRLEIPTAKRNKGRIMGWIGHWPFSMIGTFIGDFVKRIVTNIYLTLSKLYDRMANHVFAGFEE